MTTYNWLTLAIIIIGWAVTYGRLCQKINSLEAETMKQEQEIKELRVWWAAAIEDMKKTNGATYQRRDVYEAKHREIETALQDLCELRLPATLARIETSQAQLIVDVAKLQTSVQTLLERK